MSLNEPTVVDNKVLLSPPVPIDERVSGKILQRYFTAKQRLLLLDYDGTLVPFSRNPDLALPQPGLINLLTALAEDSKNDVCVISGRHSSWLEGLFGHSQMNLIAEHGARYKWKTEGWMNHGNLHNEWKDSVRAIMEDYVRICTESFVEEKEFSIVWHYRNAPVEIGTMLAEKLLKQLTRAFSGTGLQVLPGNKIIEMRQCGIDKGESVAKIIHRNDYEFILAAGDDRTDEDMFQALTGIEKAITIKVGPGFTHARFGLPNPEGLFDLLSLFQ